MAKEVGAPTIVACASLPTSSEAKVASLASSIDGADLVLVGENSDSEALTSIFGTSGPVVETSRALSLGGRSGRSSEHLITAFLQRDSIDSLETLLAAFDAIPEAWIDRYRLQVVMRYAGTKAADAVSKCYHSGNVRLISDDISSLDLERLCATSSALIIADPSLESRAFATAVNCGIATVVLAPAQDPEVGRGYVGGLLADLNRPVSVHVALNHALRLAELRFPTPEAWHGLARRLVNIQDHEILPGQILESAYEAS